MAEQTLTNAQSSPSAASVIATEVQNSCVLHFDTFCMSYKCLVQFWKMMLLSVFYVSRSTNQRHVLPSETFPFTKSISTSECSSGFLSGAWRRRPGRRSFHQSSQGHKAFEKNKYQHYPALKDEKCIEMLKDVERMQKCAKICTSELDSDLLHHCGEPSQVLERVVGHKALPHSECLHSECFGWAVNMH